MHHRYQDEGWVERQTQGREVGREAQEKCVRLLTSVVNTICEQTGLSVNTSILLLRLLMFFFFVVVVIVIVDAYALGL